MAARSCCCFQVLSYVCSLLLLAFGSQVRQLSSDDLKDIGGATAKDFIVVFFDKPAIRKSHPKFTRVFAKSSSILDSFGFELAKVDCTKETVPTCSSKDQKVFIYRKGGSIVLEELDLSYLFDEDSFVANLLHISLGNKFLYISDEQSLRELLSESQGRNNVIFFFVKGIGMKEHRQFLEMVHFSTSSDHILFAMTTDDTIPNKYGHSTGRDAALSLFHCKDMKGECHSTHYKGKIDKMALLRFLQSQTLPKYVVLPSNRITVYDSLPLAVNRVFVFSDKTSDLETQELEEMVMEFQGSVGVILVNVKEHKDMLSSFGLMAEGSNFPTAALVPVKRNNTDNMTHVELYPENVVVFTINNLKNFIKPLLENPADEYNRIAESSSLQKIQYSEYKEIMNSTDAFTNYLLASDFLLVVFCPQDHEPCNEFSKTLRRVVRTFDRAEESRLTIAYVLTSLYKKRFEGKTFPVINLHLSKSSDDYVQYTDKLGYEELMDFIAVRTSIKKPVLLPPSLSDEVPILLLKDIDDGDVTEYFEEVEEDGENESGESNGEIIEEETPAEETEDDEVSSTILKVKPKPVPEDLVPALTDKTFDVLKKGNDLLVVDFFQPWDARCKAFLQPYVDTATSLGGLDVGDFAIKLTRVNCFDWSDVCEKNNITMYPTIKMFRKGSDDIIYNGPLDSGHLTKAILLLQPTVPLPLKSKHEVEMFFDGKFPKMAKAVTDIALVGMFMDEKVQEFTAYKSAAQSLHSKFLLGYVTGETATSLSAEYGLRLPALLAFKRNDPYQAMSIFSDSFTSHSIVDFVHRSSIPSFGELTPFNLPMYLPYKHPLLIVFRTDSEDTSISPVIKKIARDNSLLSVFLCWMPVYSSKDVNAEILKAYTGSGDTLPALVMVNHDKGAVYHYKSSELSKPAVLNWVENIRSGAEPPSGFLSEGEWKPLLEGYDFLRMIDEEEEEKERKRYKKQKLEEAIEEDISEEEEKREKELSWEAKEPEDKPNKPEDKPNKPEDKPKQGRLRRPEGRNTKRDEL